MRRVRCCLLSGPFKRAKDSPAGEALVVVTAVRVLMRLKFHGSAATNSCRARYRYTVELAHLPRLCP